MQEHMKWRRRGGREMWMKRLAVKVIVERKEESVRAHSMPTGVTFVRHSARSLAKTHV